MDAEWELIQLGMSVNAEKYSTFSQQPVIKLPPTPTKELTSTNPDTRVTLKRVALAFGAVYVISKLVD